MKNLGRVIVVLVLLAALGYSGLWFYRADLVKELVQNRIERFNNSGQGKLEYADLSVTGFPLSFSIVVDRPVFTAEDAKGASGVKSAVLSAPQFVATSSFIGDSYRITSDVVTIIPEPVGDPGEENALVSINDVVIDLGFLRNGWKDILDGDINLKEPVWYAYKDGGAQIIRQSDNAELLKVEPSSLQFSREDKGADEQIDVAFDVQVQATEALKALAKENEKQKEFDNFSWECAFSLEQPKGSVVAIDDRKVSIDTCAISVDSFSFLVDGVLESAKDDFLPFGAVNITIQQHPLLLDMLVEQRILSSQQQEVIQDIIPSVVAGAEAREEDKIVVALKREKNAELHIGNTSLSNVLTHYKVQMDNYGKEEGVEAKEEGAAEGNDTQSDQP